MMMRQFLRSLAQRLSRPTIGVQPEPARPATDQPGVIGNSNVEPTSTVLLPEDYFCQMFLQCRRAMLIVQELHRLGFEKLRLVPSNEHPFGVWHCWIVPREYVSSSHGARFRGQGRGGNFPYHNGLTSGRPFGLDVEAGSHAELSTMANILMEAFPEVSRLGRGHDDEYVQWYRKMIEQTAPDGLVTAYTENKDLSDYLCVVSGGKNKLATFPLPPVGGKA